MARFRGRSRGGKPIHPTSWCGSVGGAFEAIEGVAPQTDAIVVCPSGTFETYASPTIVRIRGDLFVSLTRVDANAAEIIEYALGLMVIHDNIITPGNILDGTALEGPWLWLKYGVLASEGHSFQNWDSDSNTAIAYSRWQHGSNTFERIPVDVKAMRRVPRDHRLVLIYSWEIDTGNPDFRLNGMLRTLIKE